MEAIENYRSDLERRVRESVRALRLSQTDNEMRWVQENVSEDIRRFVCCELLGKEYDVLMRTERKYKTLADIGIEIVEQADSSAKVEQYFEIWNQQAKKVYDLGCPIFESHAHYNLKNYHGFGERLLNLMYESGICQIIIPAIEYSTNAQMINMFDKPAYDYVHFAFGSHPKYLWKEEWPEERWEEYRKLLQHSKCVAVGESGLDYSSDDLDTEQCKKQAFMFEQFIKIANECSLPMILHIRPSDEPENCPYDVESDAFRILSANRIENGAVLHCFGGSIEDVEKYLAVGVTHFGIGGRITYGNEKLEEAVRKMPEEAILLETDSPYIKVDYQHLPNTSLSLLDIAYKVAEIRNTSVEHILNVTCNNSKKLLLSKS